MSSRLKEVGSSTPVSGFFNELKNGNYWSGPYPTATSVAYYRHKGENTPHFSRRRQQGELLPFTEWEQTEINGKAAGTYSMTYTPSGDVFTPDDNASTLSKSFITPSEINTLIDELALLDRAQTMVDTAAGKIYSQGHDTLTFLAELHKTVRMFKNFAKNLNKYAQGDELYNLWLEARYGWRILMYDLIDIQKALDNLDDKRERFKERTGTDVSYTTNFDSFRDGGYGTWLHHFTDKVEYGVRGSVIADIKPPKFDFNPIVTGWELIPYSFVIDWFVSVGSFLDAMSFLTITSDYRAAKGFKLKVTRQTFDATPSLKPNWAGTWTISSDCTYEIVRRIPSSVSYSPSIQVKLNAFKVADLVALVMQGLRR